MRLRHIAALPVVKETHARSCLLFAADHPTRLCREAQGLRHPVPRLQGVFPEVELHGREPFNNPDQITKLSFPAEKIFRG